MFFPGSKYVLIAGGEGLGNDAVLSSVEVLNAKSGRACADLPPLPTPLTKAVMGTAAGGRPFVCGGMDDQGQVTLLAIMTLKILNESDF